jgi:hypothetical protein
MTDLARRRLLQAGLAGGAVLAAAGGVAWFRRRGATGDAASALDRDAEPVVRAIVPAMLASALPVSDADRARAIDETVAGVNVAIAGLPPASRAELAQLFGVLGSAFGRRVFAGVAAPWPEASVGEVDAFLNAWRASGWALKRTAYDALHQLVIGTWYANPRSWPAIGYGGPPLIEPA